MGPAPDGFDQKCPKIRDLEGANVQAQTYSTPIQARPIRSHSFHQASVHALYFRSRYDGNSQAFVLALVGSLLMMTTNCSEYNKVLKSDNLEEKLEFANAALDSGNMFRAPPTL